MHTTDTRQIFFAIHNSGQYYHLQTDGRVALGELNIAMISHTRQTALDALSTLQEASRGSALLQLQFAGAHVCPVYMTPLLALANMKYNTLTRLRQLLKHLQYLAPRNIAIIVLKQEIAVLTENLRHEDVQPISPMQKNIALDLMQSDAGLSHDELKGLFFSSGIFELEESDQRDTPQGSAPARPIPHIYNTEQGTTTMNPIADKTLAPWAIAHEDHFERYGLLAEKRSDTSVVCNLHILGGVAGQEIAPIWGKEHHNGYLLALSMVKRLTDHPDHVNAPMAPFLTKKYHEMTAFTMLLDDGTSVNAPQRAIANVLYEELIHSAQDPDTLTLPIDMLLKTIAQAVVKLFPDL